MGIHENIFFYYFEEFREISNTQLDSNFLYQYGDPNDGELFSNFKLFHVRKNIENTQLLTLSIHTFSKTNLEKSLHHSDLPIDIKKLLHIIFQLNITNFSEQFKIVKKISHRRPC